VTDERDDRLRRLHEHLAATAELPVERDAARWIGEAEAVAADLAAAPADDAVMAERVGHVRDLLSNVHETGHPEAEDHVAEARRLAAAILDETDA